MKFSPKLSKNKSFFFLFISVLVLQIGIYSCKKKNAAEEMPESADKSVSVNLENVPYQKLSDYRFFIGAMKNQVPNTQVIPYAPASSLFTDYAKKKRFLWIPWGQKASYVSDDQILDLPVGSALIKTFYYDHVEPANVTKIIETRVMIRKATGWIFANYIWNEEQTEAYLSLNGTNVPLSWKQNGQDMSTTYRIPSETECLTCHKLNNAPVPIGIKPQNMNWNYPYSNGAMNQLEKLIALNKLNDNVPSNIVSTVDYRDESQSIDMRFRSYVDINCAHCHSEERHCSYRPVRLAFNENALAVNMGLCVEPEELINSSQAYIIKPSDKNRSMMYYRMNSTLPSERMPLLGRTLVHREGLQLLEDWINWKTTCE